MALKKLESSISENEATHFDRIRKPLAVTSGMAPAGSAESPERVQEILQARARALAKSVEKESQEKSVVVLVFRLADQRYAVPLVQVVEIQSLGQYAPVPGTPPFIMGVISVRGQIFTVVNLRVFFSVQADEESGQCESILIVEDSGGRMGLLVDEVLGISHYFPTEIHDVKLNLSTIKSEYISGTTSDSVAVLNLMELLADRKMLVEDE